MIPKPLQAPSTSAEQIPKLRAVVLDVPERVCAERNASRPERQFGAHVLRNQQSQLRRSLRGLRREGFHRVFVLSGTEEIEAATFEREPLWNDRREDSGPFDIIGDVHGCHVGNLVLYAVDVPDAARDRTAPEAWVGPDDGDGIVLGCCI
jgi:hypothetical protein